MNIDSLIYTAVFSENAEEKTMARTDIRALAKQQGIFSSSIYPFYMAIGVGKIAPTFTVPAINIRAMTYDTAAIIFSLMKKHSIGPVVFEIARSEIEYTDQRPDEYAVCVLAGAIKANYQGLVFIQGDHYQLSKNKYGQDKKAEVEKIKSLVKESIDADFLNIDIDASTLVDLEKKTQQEQQETNYNITAELTVYIRSIEPKGTTISIGAEIGHIGGKNSTPEELKAFMQGYQSQISQLPQPRLTRSLRAKRGPLRQSFSEASNLPGISKISVQTGTSHGGIPLPDGTMAKVSLDFDVLEKIGSVAREKYHLGGVVQHGASTLPQDLFDQFPKHKTLEIHLATGFQNIVYDNMPSSLKKEMYTWVEQNLQKEKEEGMSNEQFIYKTRKKAIGPFKKQLWELSAEDKKPIVDNLGKQLEFLFQQLNIVNTRKILESVIPSKA